MEITPAIFDLLKQHPVEMSILLGFIIYLFRDPISKVLPDVVLKKMNIEPDKKKTESCGFYAAKRRVVYDFPTRVIIVDHSQCTGNLADLIARHRISGEEIVFNFAETLVINKYFYDVFTAAMYKAIEENNIGIKMVFPSNTGLSEDMLKLKLTIENAVAQAKTKTIQCKTDQRCKITDKDCDKGLIYFD